MVRFDPSDWEWATMLVGRNYRPDRLPKPVIDAECLLLGAKRTYWRHGRLADLYGAMSVLPPNSSALTLTADFQGSIAECLRLTRSGADRTVLFRARACCFVCGDRLTEREGYGRQGRL